LLVCTLERTPAIVSLNGARPDASETAVDSVSQTTASPLSKTPLEGEHGDLHVGNDIMTDDRAPTARSATALS
jgi:hypothetical protein